MIKIHLAILTKGWIRIEMLKWLVDILFQKKYEIQIQNYYREPVQSNRNKIVKDFLETNYDYLVMLDADIVPSKNFLDLIKFDKDIISGLCCGWRFNTLIPFALLDTKKGIKASSEQGLIKVDKVGTGALIIKKKVLEEIKRPFDVEYDKDGIVIKGEDFSFCEKAKRAGYEIWVHTDYICNHYREINLEAIYSFLQEKSSENKGRTEEKK